MTAGLEESAPAAEQSATRQKFRKKLREGDLDDKEIEIEVAAVSAQMEIFAPPGMEELTQQIRACSRIFGGAKRKARKMRIKEALKVITDEEAARADQRRRDQSAGAENVEQNGIVFLDEIDKIASRSETQGADVFAAGRAARPPAAGRRYHRVDQVRHDQDRPYPVHRQRRVFTSPSLPT